MIDIPVGTGISESADRGIFVTTSRFTRFAMRYHVLMNTTDCQAFLADLEQWPQRVQLHRAELDSLIERCMDEIFELAKPGEEKERKMELAGVEYRARLVLERWKKRSQNWNLRWTRPPKL